VAQKQKYKYFKLHDEDYETQIQRMLGEPKRIIGTVDIDFSCFAKSPQERELLKLAKMECKRDEMKHR
jgi:hypothetical protein